MNPDKETGLKDVFGDFGCNSGCKSDGWHGDIDEILAPYEAESACQKPR